MTMARFVPHGRITAHLSGPILCFDTVGPFNAEAIQALLRAYRPLLVELSGRGAYGHITTFHGSMLATPDALDAFGGLLAEWRTHGIMPSANAYVADAAVEGRSVMMPIFEKLFAGPVPFRAFHRADEAEAWIGDVLAGRH